MQPLADIACQLKVDVHCDSCKRSLMEVLRSIHGVYSVSIEVQQGRDGIAKVAGEVDPNMLLGALARSGKHAELLNVRIRHPRLRNRYSDDDHNYYNYGSSIISRYNPLSYGRSGSLPASAYYEVDQDYYPYGRRSLVEYPYSYSDNYDNRPLPRAIYVPSYPPQAEIYNDNDPISFCSIL